LYNAVVIRLGVVLATVAVLGGFAACAKDDDKGAEQAGPAPRAAPTPDAPPARKLSGTTNGLHWWLYDRPEDALKKALESKPRVIGFGEYHEQAGGPEIVPPMERFSQHMLDVIAPYTSDLLLETWVADRRCGKRQARVDKTVKKQLERPKHQETTMARLLRRTRARRIQPHRLVFSCAEYKSLLDKKTKKIDYANLLRLITQKLAETTAKILDHQAKTNFKRKTIAIYGGAFHNEKYPYDHYRQLSFVKDVEKLASYVEVDIFVPEIIRGNKRLSKEPFYPLFKTLASDDKVLLIERGKNSFIMVMRQNQKQP